MCIRDSHISSPMFTPVCSPAVVVGRSPVRYEGTSRSRQPRSLAQTDERTRLRLRLAFPLFFVVRHISCPMLMPGRRSQQKRVSTRSSPKRPCSLRRSSRRSTRKQAPRCPLNCSDILFIHSQFIPGACYLIPGTTVRFSFFFGSVHAVITPWFCFKYYVVQL